MAQKQLGAFARSGLRAEGVEQGMELDDVQPPARPQEPADNLRPAVQVGEIAQGALAGVDDVEQPPVQGLDGVVHVRLNVRHVRPGLRGDAGRGRHRGLGEVEADGTGSAPGQGDGLRTEVTLQVQHVTPGQLAEVLPLEGGEPALGVEVLVEAVEPAGEMDGRAGVPVGLVGPHQRVVLGGRHGAIQPDELLTPSVLVPPRRSARTVRPWPPRAPAPPTTGAPSRPVRR